MPLFRSGLARLNTRSHAICQGYAIIRFHHLRLPQISCSEEKAVQVASVFLGGVGGSGGGAGGGDFVLLTCNRSFDN